MTDRKVLVLGSDGKIQQVQSGDTPVGGDGSPLGGASATGTGFLHITAGSADAAAKLVATTDFAANVVDTDGTLAANSDTRLATQKATKTYVDAEATARAAADTTLQTNIDGKQPLDATLTALAGLATGADKLAYSTGTDTFSQTDLTSVARTLLAQTTQALMRTTGLGLGTIATQNASSVSVTDLAVSGLFSLTGIETGITAYVGGGQSSATALDSTKSVHIVTTSLAVAASVKLPTAVVGQSHYIYNRGGLYIQVFGTSPDIIDDSLGGSAYIWPGLGVLFICGESGKWFTVGMGLQPVANLQDVASVSTTRNNLGLGTMATQAASSVAITGGSINGATVGASTPAAVTATTLTTTGNIELGNASDTTLARVSAGLASIEGKNVLLEGNSIGATTPSTGAFTTLTGTLGEGNFSGKNVYYLHDDFERSLFDGSMFGWTGASSGGIVGSGAAAADANHVGIAEFDNNGSATGRAGMYTNWPNGTRGFTFEFVVKTSVISSVAQEYFFKFGLDSTIDGTLGTDSLFLIYDRLNYGTNWQMVVRASSTSTVRDTGVAYAADTWFRFKITIDTGGTSVQCYSSDVAAGAAVTTNIPNMIASIWRLTTTLQKTAGTNFVYAYIDYIAAFKTVTR